MAKKPPSAELIEEWRALALQFHSAADIGARYGYPAARVAEALYGERKK